jgi:hypothetical protein
MLKGRFISSSALPTDVDMRGRTDGDQTLGQNRKIKGDSDPGASGSIAAWDCLIAKDNIHHFERQWLSAGFRVVRQCTIHIAAHVERRMRMVAQELLDHLEAEIACVERDFKRMGEVVCEWHRRGDDPTELNGLHIDPNHARWLVDVAEGRLLMKAVVAYFWSKPLLDKIAALPLADQERLCSPFATVRVVVSSDTGEVKFIHPAELTEVEVEQVFR